MIVNTTSIFNKKLKSAVLVNDSVEQEQQDALPATTAKNSPARDSAN